jgi:hypothetical protein
VSRDLGIGQLLNDPEPKGEEGLPSSTRSKAAQSGELGKFDERPTFELIPRERVSSPIGSEMSTAQTLVWRRASRSAKARSSGPT